MKLTLETTYDILKENKELEFTKLFEEIKKVKKDSWANQFPSLSSDKIDELKMGEIYTYLTTDGRFVQVDSGKWGLIENYSFEEVKKWKVNVGEV